MAEDTVNALKPYFSNLKSVQTKNLRFHGTSNWRPSNEIEQHLYQRFGSETLEILSLIEKNPRLGTSPIVGQPYLLGEFVFSAQNEMATSLIDLLTRRTRAHLHDARATLKAARVICEEVAPIFGWSPSEIDSQIATYASLVESEFTSAGLIL
jgi:glycerol-3-phosphate dehydrogenase